MNNNTKEIKITTRNDALVSVEMVSQFGTITKLEVEDGIDFAMLGGDGDWATKLQDAVEDVERLLVQFTGCAVRITRTDDGKI